jgi:hypothetical protein
MSQREISKYCKVYNLELSCRRRIIEMIIDANKIEKGTKFEADVCIVGGGPAGIALARELISTQIKVVLLESGGRRFRHIPQWLNIGDNTGTPYPDLVYTRHRMLGGSTYKWYGFCRPLDQIDFEKRDWVPHSGWPVSRDDLNPFCKRANAFFQLPVNEFSSSGALADEQQELKTAAIETRLFQFSLHIGFGDVYTAEIASSGNVTILLQANVMELVPSEGREYINTALVTSQNRHDIFIKARIFVLAAGGIENAPILLCSNRVWKNGLGNQNDLVGRFFNEHPTAFYAGISNQEGNIFRGIYKPQNYKNMTENPNPVAALSVRDAVTRERKMLNGHAFIVSRPGYKLSPPYNSKAGTGLTHLAEILSHCRIPDKSTWDDCRMTLSQPGTILRIRKEQAGNKFSPQTRVALKVHLETAPNPDSRVTLSGKRDRLGMPRVDLDWRLTRQDLESGNEFINLIKQGAEDLGYHV